MWLAYHAALYECLQRGEQIVLTAYDPIIKHVMPELYGIAQQLDNVITVRVGGVGGWEECEEPTLASNEIVEVAKKYGMASKCFVQRDEWGRVVRVALCDSAKTLCIVEAPKLY